MALRDTGARRVSDIALALSLLAGLVGGMGAAHASDDFLAFGEVNAALRGGEASPEYEPLLSLFYSHNGERFRALGEFVYAPKEKELERFQVGMRVGDATVWLGRYHTPVGYVNSIKHHGSYLETTITRSRVWSYEDEGGIIPMHVAGLLVEGERPAGNGVVRYEVGTGAAAQITPGGLEPVDLLSPSFFGGSSFTAKVSYGWDGLGENAVGGYVGQFDMPVAATGGQVRQRLAGVFVNLVRERWAARSDAVVVHVAGDGDSQFANAYLELERSLGDRLLVFGRGDATVYRGRSAYLERFPDFVRRELLVGLRYDFSRSTCGKLQVGRGQTVMGRSGNSIEAQFCFVFSPGGSR